MLVLKPDNITFEQAASVPSSGFIALMNLRDASLVGSGRKVLVNGAGGGVGTVTLQYAKACGAHVTAVDSASKLGMLRSLGADQVIDYTRQDFTQGGVLYDLVFDVPGNHPFSACKRVIKPHGRYVLVGHEQYGAAGKRLFGLLPLFLKLMLLARVEKQLRGPSASIPTKHAVMAVLRQLLEAGKITPVIDSSYPLSEVREAFRHMIEDELHGKVIVSPTLGGPDYQR